MTAARAGRGFLLPGLVFLFAIDLVPLLYSGWISLYEWWLVRPRDVRFVGLANYVGLAGDPAFRRSIAVTTLFTVGAVLVEFLIGLGLALLSPSRSASSGRSASCSSCRSSSCRWSAPPCGG